MMEVKEKKKSLSHKNLKTKAKNQKTEYNTTLSLVIDFRSLIKEAKSAIIHRLEQRDCLLPSSFQ